MRAAATESLLEALLRFADKQVKLIARNALDSDALTHSLEDENLRGLIACDEELSCNPLLVRLRLFQQALGFHFRWFNLGGGHRD